MHGNSTDVELVTLLLTAKAKGANDLLAFELYRNCVSFGLLRCKAGVVKN